MKTFKIWYKADDVDYVTTWPECESKKAMLEEFWEWVVLEHKIVSVELVEELK